MSTPFEVRVRLRHLPLSQASIRAIRNLAEYDHVVFTSKNAREIFMQTLKEKRMAPPRREQIIHVGPRADLLKFPLRGKHILFPRSARAPYDIIKRLRSKGAIVRTVPLYTAYGAPLSKAQKKSLLTGKIKKLYFKSQSGIDGLLGQLRADERKTILNIPVLCIGKTTAMAAKKAGFNQVAVQGV